MDQISRIKWTNGPKVNGLKTNGPKVNGLKTNGPKVNGLKTNAPKVNGKKIPDNSNIENGLKKKIQKCTLKKLIYWKRHFLKGTRITRPWGLDSLKKKKRKKCIS